MEVKSRKILILATSYLPLIGGAELAIKNLTDRLPDFRFDLITARSKPDFKKEELIGNVNVFRVGSAPLLLNFLLPKNFLPLAIFFKAKRLLATNQYDLVYVLQASQAGGASWLLKIFGIIKQPLVINLQEGKDFAQQSWLTNFFRRRIIKSADYFIAISSYLRDFLIKQGVSTTKVFVLPNGVNMIEQHILDQNLKSRLNLNEEKIVISVSRLAQKNGLQDLIRAMAIIKSNYPKPVKLLLVGGTDSEPRMVLILKELVRDLNLNSEVIFIGDVEHNKIPAYLSIADVFVRPSISEGLGTAFLEAMAAGVPVVATMVGGIPDFLEDGKTGLYCNIGDSADIADKVMSLFSNLELHSNLSKNGKKLVTEKYGWDNIAKEFRNIYGIITKN